jgi:Lon protease-like protein
MAVFAFSHKFEMLPTVLPVFPLTGVLLLPRGTLPLNIFEPRYLAMVDHALKTDRLIGMIQPKEDGMLYTLGCAGRIISYNETTDGRYEVILSGICRFRVTREIELLNGFRRVVPEWAGFHQDMEPVAQLGLDRARLIGLLEAYFDRQGMTCSWDAVKEADDEKLITCLTMVCPFDPKEQQALLEAQTLSDRAQLFMTLLEMHIAGISSQKH